MSKKLELTGMTFGKLKVLNMYEGERKFPSTYWNCECQCTYKTHMIVRGSAMLSGRVFKCPKCVSIKNEYYKEDDHMVCVSGQGQKILFDEDDYDLLSTRTWSTSGRYASAKINDKNVVLHRLIMNAQKGQYVDHINGNRFDNRKSNLRICTNQQNQFNRQVAYGKSKYKGVSATNKNKTNAWKASIKINDKTKHVGNFKTEEEAAHAYDKKALELFGEFASLNFPNADA